MMRNSRHRQEKLRNLLDTLTKEQRDTIAEIIESADVEGSYGRDEDDGSFWEESVSSTLNCLASEFRSYDPDSALG